MSQVNNHSKNLFSSFQKSACSYKVYDSSRFLLEQLPEKKVKLTCLESKLVFLSTDQYWISVCAFHEQGLVGELHCNTRYIDMTLTAEQPLMTSIVLSVKSGYSLN